MPDLPASHSIAYLDSDIAFAALFQSNLRRYEQFTLVGLGRTESEALALCARTRPDIVVLDPEVSDDGAVALVAKIRLYAANAKILLFPRRPRDALYVSIERTSIAGIVRKDCGGICEAMTALEAVAGGGTYYAEGIAEEQRMARRRLHAYVAMLSDQERI